VAKAFRKAVEIGDPYDLEVQLVTAKGRQLWVRTVARTQIIDGRVVRVFGNIADITERKLAEIALHETERTLATMLSNLPGMAYRCRNDQDWTMTFVSEGCLALTGHTVEDFHSTRIVYNDLIHPDDQAMVWDSVQRAVATKQHFQLTYRILPRGEAEKWVWERGKGVFDDLGELLFLEGFITDITERKRAEDALLTLNSQLSRVESINAARLRLHQYADTHSLDDLLQKTLDEAEALSGSCVGFYHFVDNDQTHLTLQNWSTRTKAEFCTATGKGLHYPISEAGVWVDCVRERRPVIHNDYSSLPDRKGLPEGHAVVVREIAVPVIRGDRIRAILGVGNKPEDYTEQDLDAVSLLANLAWDIAERKRAEEALRDSEERYHLLFEEMSEGFALHEIICDDNGQPIDYRYLDVNPAFERLTGLSREVLIGHNVLSILPQLEAYWVQSFGQVALTGRSLHLENYAEPLGKWYDVIAFSPRLGQFAVTFSDITERKAADDALRESENLLRESQIIAGLGNYVLDIPSGKWSSSGVLDRLFGIDEAYERSIEGWSALIHPDDRTGMTEYFQNEVLGRRSVFDREYRIIRHNSGDERWVHGLGKLEFGAHGHPVKMHGTIRDITERKMSEEEIQKLNAELEQRIAQRTAQLAVANEELEAFAYSVSHDLRAPLRGIDGWSLALLEDCRGQLDERGCDYLDRVRAETQRMGQLIDDLLQLSRVTRAEMRTGTADLSALANSVALRLQEANPDRAIEFTVQPGITVDGDAHLLEIVLTNLLGNAVKFTSTRPIARVEFGKVPAGNMVAYYVRDNGVGFDAAYAGKLFGAFQRMHRQSEFPGSGIGLATVQRIIHRHGGRVWADAQVGEGATFLFTLETSP
jgi:PAS domain S-box-containing protein